MTDLKMTTTGDCMQSEALSAVREIVGDRHWAFKCSKSSGYWLIGGGGRIYVTADKKPTPEQIKNTEEAFGWEWKDYE